MQDFREGTKIPCWTWLHLFFFSSPITWENWKLFKYLHGPEQTPVTRWATATLRNDYGNSDCMMQPQCRDKTYVSCFGALSALTISQDESTFNHFKADMSPFLLGGGGEGRHAMSPSCCFSELKAGQTGQEFVGQVAADLVSGRLVITFLYTVRSERERASAVATRLMTTNT